MKKAFTLIELLIVIGVIAVLTVAFLPNALSAPAKARDAGRIKSINDIAASIETYRGSGRAEPATAGGCLAQLAVGPAGMAAFATSFGGNALPGDSSVQSCSMNDQVARVQPAVGQFPYFYYPAQGGGYVIAARMEVAGSGNFLVSAAPGTNPWDVLVTDLGLALQGNPQQVGAAIATVDQTVQNQIANPPGGANLVGYYVQVGR